MHKKHVVAEILSQMFGDLADVGVFEKQDRGDVQAVLVVDHIAERCEADRIEAQIQQHRVKIDIVGIDLEEFHHDPRQRILDRNRQIASSTDNGRDSIGVGGRDSRGRRRSRRVLHADAPHAFDLILHALQHCQMRQVALQAKQERLDTDIPLQRPDAQIALEKQRGLLIQAHAAFGPDGPVEAERFAVADAGARARVSLRGERIHEVVRKRVITLAGIAGKRCQRRKHHEEIQRLVAGRVVQQHRSADLGREHGLHFVARLVAYISVAQHAGTVDDAVQPAVAVFADADESFDILAFGHVGLRVDHIAASGAHRFERHFRFGFQRTASAEDHPRLELLCQMLGEDQTQTTRAAGDEVDAAMPDRRCVLHRRYGFWTILDPAQITLAVAVAHRERFIVMAEFQCDCGDRRRVEASMGRHDFENFARKLRALRAQDRCEALDRLVVRLRCLRRVEIQIL